MLRDVVEVRPLDGSRLYVRFEDGVQGEIDVKDIVPMDGVFAPLKAREEFIKVSVHPELGTVVWPSGADLAPETLYTMLAGKRFEAQG